MKLHILTLNWNGADKLKKLHCGLDRNLSKIKDINSIWHIRDNGSKDNSIEEIRSWSFNEDYNLNTVVHSIEHNRHSFALGVNYLFDVAAPSDSDIIIILNNDIEFNDDYSLSKMYNLIKKENIGVVGARLLYPDTNILQHAGVIFSPRYNLLPYHYRHKEKSDKHSEKNRYFQAVTAACCMVKASSFRRVNKLDQDFHWAFEDVSLCLSIGKDEKIVYCGETDIYHEESASIKKNNINKLFLNNNVKCFREKWGGKYDIDHDKYLNNSEYLVVK